MSLVQRFRYLGEGPDMGAYSGAYTPEIRRTRYRRATRSDGGLPRFARFVAGGRPRDVYRLAWAGLTRNEVDQIVRDFEAAGSGTVPLYYTPDDRSEPIQVLALGKPQVAASSAVGHRVSLTLEEQR